VTGDFDVWDVPMNALFVSIKQGGEPTGGRNITIKINANFNTKKVLMGKLRSDLQLAASEVEFFTSKY
jgi:hypothetical protein